MNTEEECPMCGMNELTEKAGLVECVTCGHEWYREDSGEEESGPREIKDAHGNVLSDGDVVQMIKDKKLKGTSTMLKCGDKSKPIRLVEGDHDISCKMNGHSIMLKSMYVKKVMKP